MKACIINHGRNLDRTLASLPIGMDTIIVEGNIKSCSKDYQWESEAEMRNFYLKPLEDGEWFLSIDSDEVLTSQIRKPSEAMLVALVRLNLGDDFVLAPRLIKYHEGMEYETHYLMKYKDQYINLSFLSETFNNKHNDKKYYATVEHLRRGHTKKELKWKEKQRLREKKIEKQIVSKGGKF